MMNAQEAILGFSQAEKVKSGLIWTSQVIQLIGGWTGGERAAGVKTAGALVRMVNHEIMLVRNMSDDPAWREIQKDLDKAGVMIESGIPSEAIIHLTRALSKSTDVAGRAMAYLKDEGLL